VPNFQHCQAAPPLDNVEKQDLIQMPHATTIEREELNGVHEFVLRIDGERHGHLEFTRPGVGVLHIDYVEVSPELRGRGLGLQLVQKAVAFAKDAKLRVVPMCSYARAVIHRDPVLSAALK
jgi:uncharacterized protein